MTIYIPYNRWTGSNKKRNKRRRFMQKAMRRMPTKAEKALYQCCKALGLRAITQHCMCGYFVDIYLPLLTIAIEADGPTHDGEEAQANDAARTRNILRAFPNVKIVRYKNAEILNDANFFYRLKADLIRESGMASWPFKRYRSIDNYQDNRLAY